jgi:hypothetical protein
MADLAVGKLDADQEATVSKVLLRLSVEDDGAWRHCPKNLATIGLFNLGSIVLFNHHVANLEGIANKGLAYQKTRFVNLTWWIYSIWLPIDFAAPREPALPDNVFLGSSVGLLNELAEVRKLSPLSLGTTPPGYDAMRSDIRTWFKSRFELVGDQAIIQWIWKGLDEAARISIEESAPIFGGD